MIRSACLALLGLIFAAGCSAPDRVSRVVVVTFDTTRADRIGAYGFADAVTPNLDSLAAESVLFENAVSPVPTTLPSHSSMFTGLYPQDHGIRYNIVFQLKPEATTLAEVLQAHGYRTAAFPAAYVLDTPFGLNQGFDTYTVPEGLLELQAGGHPDDVMRNASDGVDLAIEWLSETSSDKSFLWLHFYDPHAPHAPPFPYSSRFRDRPYDGEITYTDAQFGRLLEFLRQDSRWDETLLVVAGDHGEGLHDHRERWHSYLVYQPTQWVPFIVRAPGARPARIAEPIALSDLMPTVLDLAGFDVPSGLRGISLRPAIEGRSLPTREIYFETLAGALNYGWQELKGIRSGNWKLIDSADPELFDLAADPGETTNLFDLEAERAAELGEALADLARPLSEAIEGQPAQPDVLDPETEALLASLGYTGDTSRMGESGPENARHPRDVVDLDVEMQNARTAIAKDLWDVVEQMVTYVLERDATNRWALKTGAMALMRLDRSREAQDLAAELVRNFPDAEGSYTLLAETYAMQTRFVEADEVLETAAERFPESEKVDYLRLVVAFDAEREDVCDVRVPDASARYPESWRVLVLEARCAAREGRPEHALEILTSAVDKGFRQFEVVENADDFAGVVTLDGFRTLVEGAGKGSSAPDRS